MALLACTFNTQSILGQNESRGERVRVEWDEKYLKYLISSVSICYIVIVSVTQRCRVSQLSDLSWEDTNIKSCGVITFPTYIHHLGSAQGQFLNDLTSAKLSKPQLAWTGPVWWRNCLPSVLSNNIGVLRIPRLPGLTFLSSQWRLEGSRGSDWRHWTW